jgi:hypothetical protein
MSSNPRPHRGAFPHVRRSSLSTRPLHVASAALCAALIATSGERPAYADAAPFAEGHDPDPFDLLLDHELRGDAPDSSSGALSIGLEASLRMSSQGASSFGGFAFVQIPFERLLGPPRSGLVRTSIADGLRPTRGDRSDRGAAPEQEPPASDTTGEAPEKPARLVVTISSDLARGAVRAACKAQKLDEAEARLDSLASRSKTSAFLPELRLRATRLIDESESIAPTEYDPLRRTASGGASTWLEARATFRLDRAVFADDEIAVERLRLARAAERTKLVAKVLDLLEAWQRARTAEVDPDTKPEAHVRSLLAVASSEAALDVLTNGWFSKAIASPDTHLTRSAAAAGEGTRDAAHPSDGVPPRASPAAGERRE